MDESTQLCGTCERRRPLTDFVPSKRGRDGQRCKPCSNEARRSQKRVTYESEASAPSGALQCSYCGEWYVPKQLKRNAKYCSHQCWSDERKAKAEAERLAKACCPDSSCYLHVETQRCGHCKQPKPLADYSPSYRGILGCWCRPCYSAYTRGERLPAADHEPLQCVECDKWYIPTNLYEKRDARSKYCSRECNNAAKSAIRRAQLIADRGERTCQHSVEPIPSEAVRNMLYCSTECCRKADRILQHLKRGVRTEVSTATRLFLDICIRDNWVCGLCHEPVDKTVRHPDPMCLSLDHIIQRHWGGTNDPDNLRLTHLACNQRRPRKRELDMQYRQPEPSVFAQVHEVAFLPSTTT